MSDDPLKEPEDPTWDGKSMGQAMADDQDEVDDLLEETGGDEAAAERQFDSDVDEVGTTAVRAEGEEDSRSEVGG